MIGARPLLLLAFLTTLGSASVAGASDELLARAKDLYRDAAYDEALAVLEQIKAPGSDAETAEYRLFCLIALDRKGAAQSVIEAMVTADPFYQLSGQAPPRVRTMFKDVRQSLLPAVVQRAYAEAKAAFDKKDPQSVERFERVLDLLGDPDLPASPALADLHTVVTGFRDLSKAAAAPPAAPPPATAPSAPAGPPAPVAAAKEPEAPLVPPVALKQTMPRWYVRPGQQTRGLEGLLEVTIDERGDVVSASLRNPIHPAYDPLLIKSAMEWKYTPARRNGVPVRHVVLIAIHLDAGN